MGAMALQARPVAPMRRSYGAVASAISPFCR